MLADRVYDNLPRQEGLWAYGIIPFLANRSEIHGSRLGTYRYMAERAFT